MHVTIVYITHKGFSDILLKPFENIPDVTNINKINR